MGDSVTVGTAFFHPSDFLKHVSVGSQTCLIAHVHNGTSARLVPASEVVWDDGWLAGLVIAAHRRYRATRRWITRHLDGGQEGE